jgi:hypothetical protein
MDNVQKTNNCIVFLVFWFYGFWPLNDAWPRVLGLMYVEFWLFVLTPADDYVMFGLYFLSGVDSGVRR